MRIGLFSDVHANLEALETTLRLFDAQKVDMLICMGDVVGYGAQPEECCTLIRTLADHTVLGNHDAAVCGRMDYSYYRLAARQALDLHAHTISDTNMEWLKGLPYTVKLDDLAFCHGSPLALEDFEYIFVLDQMRDLVAQHEEQAAVTFIGHSHLCKCFSFNENKAEEILRTRFTLDPDQKYILTCGSVGQPRDYDTRACCSIFDTETRAFEYFRLHYDIESAARKIFAADLAVTFGKRLFLGV